MSEVKSQSAKCGGGSVQQLIFFETETAIEIRNDE